MRDFFKSTRFKILLAFLAFLIGIMIYGVTKGGYSLSGTSFVNTITKPFRSAANSISMKIEHSIDKISNATEYYNENQRLKQQIGELNEQLTDYEALQDEVEELRKLVTIKEEHEDYVFSVPCEVLSYVANDPFKSFTINKGSEDEIEPNCPVITSEGLVGITVEVSEHVSTVRTILSPDLSIASVCSSSAADTGIIEGTILDAANGNTRLIHVNINNQLEEGDLIVTNGNSGLFPKGYTIGTVKSVSLDSSGLSACAEIEPCIDITRLTYVTVITDFDGKKEAEADED